MFHWKHMHYSKTIQKTVLQHFRSKIINVKFYILKILLSLICCKVINSICNYYLTETLNDSILKLTFAFFNLKIEY